MSKAIGVLAVWGMMAIVGISGCSRSDAHIPNAKAEHRKIEREAKDRPAPPAKIDAKAPPVVDKDGNVSPPWVDVTQCSSPSDCKVIRTNQSTGESYVLEASKAN